LDIIVNENISFIHSHTPTGAFLGRLVSIKLGIKNLYTVHGFHFYKGAPLLNWVLYYPIEKWLSFFTDAILTINQEDYKIAQGWITTKIYYLPGVGIDIDRYYRNLNKTESNFIRLLSIGELNKNKNIKFVIEQLKNVDSRIEYYIAGKGHLNYFLESLISRLDLKNRVHLLGFVDDVSYILSYCDIFIMPSLREGLPVALMEAMAAGLPILASNIRGVRDLVDVGKGGFLFDLKNPDDFNYKLKLLLNDKNLRIKMGQYNRIKARDYDITSISKQMKEIYSQVTNECLK
jgi:glycosyltransferase involved in cell wall biosynthesis